MANGEASSWLQRDVRREYPDDPSELVFEAVASGNPDLLSELLQPMNPSERASALGTVHFLLYSDKDIRPCPHVSGNFFFRKYFFADAKNFLVHTQRIRIVFSRPHVSDCIWKFSDLL